MHCRVIRSLSACKLPIGDVGRNCVRRIRREVARILKLRISVLCLLIASAVHHRINSGRCIVQRRSIAITSDIFSLCQCIFRRLRLISNERLTLPR
ncbi:hypothetical protein SZ54_4470 [Rhizobium sp. UR51a]|nr:hypothetical protein SZ54_4470 [Rhizobium sp. UR51a]